MSVITMDTPLRVHYFQHIADEGFGSCIGFLKSMGAHITSTEFFALPTQQKLDVDALPRIEDVDLLIIMGGAMSVNDEHIYPWLMTEKRWLRRFIATGKPVIGLCLGGQLIAQALGANVVRNKVQEVGWTTVNAVNPYPEQCFKVPEQFEVMQWHSETFDLPKGAHLLAWTEACKHQMFQIGGNIIGFQFHPEMTPETIALYLEDEEESNHFLKNRPEIKKQLIASTLHSAKAKYAQGNQILIDAIQYVIKNTKKGFQLNENRQMSY